MYNNQYQPQQQGYPYSMYQPFQAQAPLQHYEIIHVNGENGARSFRMAPNSQCLLLDDTNPIVWLAQTDGAGYPTLTPYTIAPYQAAPPQVVSQQVNSDWSERLARLEEIVYGKSDVSNAEPAGRKSGSAGKSHE